MKKHLAVFLAGLLCLTLAGCQKEEPKLAADAQKEKAASAEAEGQTAEREGLRVLIDMDFGTALTADAKKIMKEYEADHIGAGGREVCRSFQEAAETRGGPEDIQLEFPPKHGDGRDAYLTRLRTEIMAGGGPDLFICLSGYGWHLDRDPGGQPAGEICQEDGLFRFPQQAMERGLFLPLNDYIENARFMEWDRLTSVIMEAGRQGGRQLLLPMTYTMSVGYFRGKDVSGPLDPSLAWEDMLSGGPELLAAAAGIHPVRQSAALYPLADYERDELAVTEEELLDYVQDLIQAREAAGELELEMSCNALSAANWLADQYGPEEELAIVPVCSRSGGYTALITSYMAINANTRRPEEAFWLADYLMSEEGQTGRLFALATHTMAVPVMEGLMADRASGISDAIGGKVYMNENQYRAFCQLRDGISAADFITPLERELNDLYNQVFSEEAGKPVESLVHDAYTHMRMDLGES